jgi:hypothetical protein
MKTKKMNLTEALEMAHDGHVIARKNWPVDTFVKKEDRICIEITHPGGRIETKHIGPALMLNYLNHGNKPDMNIYMPTIEDAQANDWKLWIEE